MRSPCCTFNYIGPVPTLDDVLPLPKDYIASLKGLFNAD